jgi:hypothetical protein
MKITEIRPSVESSGTFEEQMFSIQDTGMIFDILRNKMYSNPIAAICREIACNARDAHREVGKGDVPIHIHLPNAMEPFYKIKDFGPGISPDRMLNIFIRYTASTKRNDNIQTGGFGLGAKTPFSYSDTFVIITNYNGIKYNYSAVIDETKVGKIVLLSSEHTDEPNGTEIIIPVKTNDFNNFSYYTEVACRHWTVKPIVTGVNAFKFREVNKIIYGNNWAIVKSDDWAVKLKLIIDGIEYPCKLEHLHPLKDAEFIRSIHGDIYLYFPVGELSISANRESIYLDDTTKNKINNMFEVIKYDLKSTITQNINKFDNLWDANLYVTDEVRHICNNSNLINNLNWRGYKVTPLYKDVDSKVFSFIKGNKICRTIGREIHFRPKTILVMNDLKIDDVTTRHVKDFFKDNIVYVEVIHPGDKNIDILIGEHQLDKMGLRYLSEVTSVKIHKNNRNPDAFRMNVFKLIGNKFTQISYKGAKEASGRKIICKLKHYGSDRNIVLPNGKIVNTNIIKKIKSLDETLSFYGVDESVPDDRIKKDFKHFESFHDFMTSLIPQNIDYVGIKYASTHTNLPYYCNIDTKSMTDKSLFKRTVDNLKKLNDLAKQYNLLDIYELVNDCITHDQLHTWVMNNRDLDVDLAIQNIENKYSLLPYVDRYGYNHGIIDNKLIEYINLVDSNKGT